MVQSEWERTSREKDIRMCVCVCVQRKIRKRATNTRRQRVRDNGGKEERYSGGVIFSANDVIVQMCKRVQNDAGPSSIATVCVDVFANVRIVHMHTLCVFMECILLLELSSVVAHRMRVINFLSFGTWHQITGTKFSFASRFKSENSY